MTSQPAILALLALALSAAPVVPLASQEAPVREGAQDGAKKKKKKKKKDDGKDEATGEGDLQERIRALEKRVRDLEKDAVAGMSKKDLDDKIEDEIEKHFSRGVLTIGGAELRLGGKLEINFVDTENENDPIRGSTDNPDPHFDFDRIRLEPVLDVGRKMEIRAQIDFLPEDGETLLKEGVFAYEFQSNDYWEDVWWFRSRMQVGLDDRFTHLGPRTRLTETYPLIGTAFWRDEEIAFIWENIFGRKRGAPVKEEKKKKKSADAEFASVPREEKTSSTTHEPFDFANNPGAFKLLFSIGDGYNLDGKAIGKDGARMQEILQDDRETRDQLSLRSLGFGVGYERDFNWLGEIELLAFYFDDELKEDSIDFLQQDLTEFDSFGTAISGYGTTSQRDVSRRMGFQVAYHLEAYHLLDQWLDTWPGDGLYLTFQWIDARDGKLDRSGWYVQGSYRFSFPTPLVNDRYFRSIEPVFRYGELDTDTLETNFGGAIGTVRVDNNPSLPLTWDRQEILVGAVFGITEYMFLKAEYAFNMEDTADSGDEEVDNDELLIQLLLEF